MSNEHTISVKISEAEVNDMLLAVGIEGTVNDLKDTVDDLEYQLQELKDIVDEERMDYSEMIDNYNDLDDRLSELENDKSAETFAERLEALENNTSNDVPPTNMEYTKLRKDVDHLLELQELQVNLFYKLINHITLIENNNNDFSKGLQSYIELVNGYKKD
tara:strand:- start:1115 stop:1597 length:483 start_codon:yes stop_codon:yes gene_type:complete